MCYNKINHGQSVLPNPKERRIYPCRVLLSPTPKALSDEQKDELKKTIGQKISLIPGKTRGCSDG